MKTPGDGVGDAAAGEVPAKRARAPATSEETTDNSSEEGDDDAGGEVSKKRARATPAMSEEICDNSSEEGDARTAWLRVDDEAAAELAKLLDAAEAVAAPAKVRFIDDPYSSQVMFQWSPLYITINGNEESCGSSFSDWESSVMASIDINRRREGGGCVVQAGSAWGPEGEEGSGGTWEKRCGVKGREGCDCLESDDEMLARFIGEEVRDGRERG